MNLRKKSSGRSIPPEEWFAELYRKIPAGDSREYAPCNSPDDAFLRRLARSSRKPSLLDPRVTHVAQCPRCLSRLTELRNSPSRRDIYGVPLAAWIGALAFALVGAAGLSFYLHKQSRKAQAAALTSNVASFSQTLDLSSDAPTRGAPEQLWLVSIPRRNVDLTLILPALSETGSYSVAVRQSKQDDHTVATGQGTAVSNNRQTLLKVTLHLEDVAPGIYYLSTTHETDAATYYYPLKVLP